MPPPVPGSRSILEEDSTNFDIRLSYTWLRHSQERSVLAKVIFRLEYVVQPVFIIIVVIVIMFLVIVP
jgi:hypothetical protein